MDHSASFLETDTETGSIWPWVIALLAGVGMLLAVAQTSKAIPASIAQQVRQNIAAQGVSGVSLEVDGRDVLLGGVIQPGVDRGTFVARVARVEGVRRVVDNLTVFDPEAAAAKRRNTFAREFARVNFSLVAFERGSASLTEDSLPALDSLIQLLLSYPEQRVRVSGHTDNTGRPAVNLRISRERAQAVAGYLVSRGVTTSQVVARGFGASRPVADNNSDAGRARNRRIDIEHIK